MNLSNKDIQILKHVIRYCEKIESTVRRFGEDFDTFLNDPDYRDSVGMNLLQIGELAGKLSARFRRRRCLWICSFSKYKNAARRAAFCHCFAGPTEPRRMISGWSFRLLM